MRRRPAPRRLVVDADIARAAGRQRSQDPTGTASRDFLLVIQEAGHRLAMSDELSVEWRAHGSQFSVLWLGAIKASGRLENLGPVRDRDLRRTLGHAARDQAQRERMLHDAHLVETARRADRVVCSRDEAVRSDFRQCAASVTQLEAIVWVNPTLPDEDAAVWLRTGARSDPHRRLDHPWVATINR